MIPFKYPCPVCSLSDRHDHPVNTEAGYRLYKHTKEHRQNLKNARAEHIIGVTRMDLAIEDVDESLAEAEVEQKQQRRPPHPVFVETK